MAFNIAFSKISKYQFKKSHLSVVLRNAKLINDVDGVDRCDNKGKCEKPKYHFMQGDVSCHFHRYRVLAMQVLWHVWVRINSHAGQAVCTEYY